MSLLRLAPLALVVAIVPGCFFAVGTDADYEAPPSDAVEVAPGTTPSVSGNRQHVRLREGVYRGDLVVTGNHCVLEGAGAGRTIIEGSVRMAGNHNVVRGVSVTAPSAIGGNHNSASEVEFRAGVDVRGNASSD